MTASAQNFDYPSNTPVVEVATGMASNPWQYWFSRINTIIQTGQQSGTTANRPKDQLWVGRQYFDTTLNKPVFVSSVKPAVWRDAMANIV